MRLLRMSPVEGARPAELGSCRHPGRAPRRGALATAVRAVGARSRSNAGVSGIRRPPLAPRGLAGLGVAAGLVACCLRLESPIEFLLATYVLAWTWLVGGDPPPLAAGPRDARLADVRDHRRSRRRARRRGSARGRPRPPSFRARSTYSASPCDARPSAVLAVAVALGAAYTFALAFLTSVVEGDAHAYHLARAAFWKQEHELGYVADAVELRLNVNPPNAEIGQLATMLLSGGDRFVALPQLAAYGALARASSGSPAASA